MSVQIIEKDGQPEWAVLPYEDYQKLLQALDDKADAAAITEAVERIKSREEEVLPAEITERLLSENPYKVWREYRRLTLQDLADAAGVSRSYVSMIEKGERTPSDDVRDAIARKLNIDPSDVE